jgi:hypothetical protein
VKRILFLLFALAGPFAAWSAPLMIGDVGWPKTNAISSGCTPIPGIVGHWPCDDGSGNIAIDTSGYGNDLFFSGSPTWVPAFLGDGISCSASDLNEFAFRYGPATIVAGLTNATMAGWINTTNNFAFGFNDFPFTRFSIILESGESYWCVENSDASYPYCPFTPDGSWHFFVLTFDGTKSGFSRVTAYIDGVMQTLTTNNVGGFPGGNSSPGLLPPVIPPDQGQNSAFSWRLNFRILRYPHLQPDAGRWRNYRAVS